MIFFSIIIPAFNAASTIKNTIESVFNQTFNNYEIIVIDDGSTDKTNICLQQFSLYKRFRYVFQENLGVSAARNNGANLAKGDYIIFLDSDDYVSKTWLMDFYQSIFEEYPDLSICGMYDIRRKKNFINMFIFFAGTVCIKRSFFLQVGGYDDRLKYGENTELSWRILNFKPKINYIDKINIIYNNIEKPRSHYLQKRLEAFKIISMKHNDLLKKNRQLGQSYYQVAAVDFFLLKNYVEARKHMKIGYFSDPYNPVAFLRFILIQFTTIAKIVWRLKK